MKILLVDDDAARSERIVGWLHEIGFSSESVVVSSSVNDARGKISKTYFDVLLLDVVLPKRSGDKPAWGHGIWLLEYINKSATVRKPEKIVGITAYSEDIDSFKSKFEKHCLAVIEVKRDNDEWQEKLSGALNYTKSSKLARREEAKDICVVTVHGIRTFGHWQSRLEAIVCNRASFVGFESYKYGYFTIFSFLIPYLQRREVKKLTSHLRQLFLDSGKKKLVIFCHSFGTYLVAHALKQLSGEDDAPYIDKLVLSGSVLKADFDWAFVKKFEGMKVINECGTNDYVLWLSEAFIPKTGMAGKTGFYGFHSEKFMNRYFKGGHDLYFKGDTFMEENWLPLISAEEIITPYDARGESNMAHMIIEKTFSFVGRGLPAVLVLASLTLAWSFV